MSTTLKSVPYARFIRQARTKQAALVASQATLNQAIEALKVSPWRKTRTDLAVTMPASDPKQTESSDAYDAYKFSGDCPDKSGMQAAFVGMVAYRWKLPSNSVYVDPVVSVAANVNLYANKFLSAGLRITSFTSNEDDPANLGTWEFLRGETGGVSVISEQFKNQYAGTKLATNKDAVVTVFSGPIVHDYLWVIVQLEDWDEIKFEYWIEGAGFLSAPTMAMTFDADNIVLDPVEATTEIPAILDGNIFAPLLDDRLIVQQGGRIEPSTITTREFSSTCFTIGTTANKDLPSDEAAIAGIPPMFAKVLSGAAKASIVTDLVVNGGAADRQAGLTTVITRRIANTVSPFKQQLCAWISPLTSLISFPDGFAPSLATVTNSSSSSVQVAGCDMALDIWWAKEREVSLQEVGVEASKSGFWYDGLSTGVLSKVGTIVFPSVMNVGDKLLIPLTGPVSKWGTVVIAFRILRVTATTLPCDSFIGVQGVNITSESILGSGWYPDLTFA